METNPERSERARKMAGCTKEAAVDDADIDRAIVRRTRFLSDPEGHTLGDDEG
jgi:hypothetical protein